MYFIVAVPFFWIYLLSAAGLFFVDTAGNACYNWRWSQKTRLWRGIRV